MIGRPHPVQASYRISCDTLSSDWSPVTGGSLPRLVIALVGQYWTHNPQNEHWPAKKFHVIPVSRSALNEIAFGEQTVSHALQPVHRLASCSIRPRNGAGIGGMSLGRLVR